MGRLAEVVKVQMHAVASLEDVQSGHAIPSPPVSPAAGENGLSAAVVVLWYQCYRGQALPALDPEADLLNRTDLQHQALW